MTIDLIYCAGGNQRLMQIAHDAGLRLGIRSDKSAYGFPISFVDINYHKASETNFAKHLAVVACHQPKYAIVPDLRADLVGTADIDRALHQYTQLAQHCEIPLIVPKLPGQIALLPFDVVIAYSIPTSYGGARYGLHELAGRQVHLLGGNPAQQQKIARWISAYGAIVLSADGNMAQKASQKATYWRDGKWRWHERSGSHESDLMYDCWQRSCQNIYHEWSER